MAPPPPPPSAVELAAQEVVDQLAQQSQALMAQIAQQQQSVQTQMAAIQAVVGRAHEIAAQTGLPAPEIMPTPPAPDLMGIPGAEMDPAGATMTTERGGVEPGMSPEEAGAGGMPVEEPGMMESAMQLEDPDMFDTAAIASLAQSNNFDNTVSGFLPALRTSLDALGRMLTEVRMKAPILRERIGDGSYNEIRDQLESLFEGLGEAILRVNAIVASDENVDAPT